jgi:hypothetical protein
MRALHAALRRDLSRLQAVASGLPGRAPAPAEVLPAGTASARSWRIITLPRTTTCGRCCAGSCPTRQTGPCSTRWSPSTRRSRPIADVDSALRNGGDLAAAAERLSVVVRTHLQHEEREVLPLVKRHPTGAEWRSFLRTERSRTPLRNRPEFLTWILDDAHQPNAAAVLAEMPPPARLVYRRSAHATSGR